jgi:hypothetical protein
VLIEKDDEGNEYPFYNALDIEISEDPEFGEQFVKAVVDYYNNNNTNRIADGKLHIADITYCIRKTLIPQVFPSQAGVNIYSASNFMRGSGAESSIIPVLNYLYKDDNNEFQMDIQFDNVTGHPDFVNHTKGIVFELKNTNAQDSLTISSDNLKSYTRQVVYYMLLTGMEEGKVIVQYGLPFEMEYDKDSKKHTVTYRNKQKKVPYFFYKINIAPDHPLRTSIKHMLNNMIRPAMVRAVKERDLTIIPILKEKKERHWKCMTCEYKKTCDMIPDKQDNPMLRDLLLNVHIDSLVNVKQ